MHVTPGVELDNKGLAGSHFFNSKWVLLKHVQLQLRRGIFNFCIRKGVLPDVWKLASIVPLPKKPNPKAYNDYRPVALPSVVIKCFQNILKSWLSSFVKLNENQFA